VPGSPDNSLLIKAIRYTDPDLQMPPKNKKLSPKQIADLEAWVKMGAPDPRTGAAIAQADQGKARAHWAFQRVTEPAIPRVRNKRWVQTPIDAFVLAKLESRKMKPSPVADRRALIRRATYDLTGLPPTPEEVAAFLADKSPQAFATLVDRLLESPHYGERWGRYWLDVARYADTKGYIGAGESRYPYAYTYRDYVIRSFNEDLPFDRFLLEQIAADQLKPGEDNRSLAALGFLTVGRRFINNENDIIDDRIDVVGRGLMGLTVSCARCHDHKFDPIPTQDYYSLYGVFKSSTEPGELPLLSHQAPNPAYPAYQAELTKRQDELKNYTTSNEVAVLTQLRSQVGDYLLALHDCKDLNDVKRDELVRGQRKMNMAVFKRWEKAAKDWPKTNNPTFSAWLAFDTLTEKEFSAKAKELAAGFAANSQPTNRLNPLVARAFAGVSPTNLQHVASVYNQLFKGVAEHWQAELALADPVTVLPQGKTNAPPPAAFKDPNEEALRQVLFADNAPANPPRDQFGNLFLFNDTVKNKTETLKKNIVALDASHPGAPARAMVINDKPKPVDVKVFVRGNPGTPGPLAPRRFLEITSGPRRELFPTNASGRLEMAKAIVSRDNPLTARVFVNRVWLNHFGAPLVTTPSDFGLRAEAPTQLELLDYLAARFMEDGWSVKKLQRLIMLSSTYQQSSGDQPAYAKVDPENKYLWRMNRRRLDFEALRDSLLAISASLNPDVGGQPLDITTNAPVGRRTVYGYVDRQDLPNLFRVFDFANPDTSSPQRFQTIVAPQALYLLNSQFVIDRVKRLVEHAKASPAVPKRSRTSPDEQELRRLYQLLFQREPSRNEIKMALGFLQDHPGEDVITPEVVAWKYGSGLYDSESGRVVEFAAMTNFNGKIWQFT
ncbi:MAG: PSD1 domain-containing protein, partial [Pedosphaera parvula]|nr:PSD1 domain-containing protein [Pedosphaera parvula]